jgi:hypothetical protein
LRLPFSVSSYALRGDVDVQFTHGERSGGEVCEL